MKKPGDKSVSTEGRVFVAQLTRDLAARERVGAAALSPGATTWRDAFHRFAQSLADAASPTKGGAILRAGYGRLRPAHNQHACTVNFYNARSRSGAFEVWTYEVSKHPLTDEGNAGVAVQVYFFRLQRRGALWAGYRTVAFLSWHALARMRERSKVDMFAANGVVVACGAAGYVMGESPKHINTEINCALADMLCTGVLRSADNKQTGQRYEFFDVLTVLPFDEALPQKREQGTAIGHAAYNYIKANDPDPRGIGDKIAVIPFHQTDFISRQLVPR